MATLKLSFIKCVKKPFTTYTDREVIKTISVVGKKSGSETTERYFCHKNPYGIVWVIGTGGHYNICTDKKWVKGEFEALPIIYDYDYIVVRK